MLTFMPSDGIVSASQADYEGSTIKLDDIAAQLSSAVSVGPGLPSDLSSSDSIYPSMGPQIQDCESSTHYPPQQKPGGFRRKIIQRDQASSEIGVPAVKVGPSSHAGTSSSKLIPAQDYDALTADSNHVLLTSPNDSSSDSSSIHYYKGDDSITVLQSDVTETKSLLLLDSLIESNKMSPKRVASVRSVKSPSTVQMVPFIPSVPSMPAAVSFKPSLPRMPSATQGDAGSVRSVKGLQKISFTNSFMTAFGPMTNTIFESGPAAPQTSLNNTVVNKQKLNQDSTYRSKSAKSQVSVSEKTETSELHRKTTQNRRALGSCADSDARAPSAPKSRPGEQHTAISLAEMNTTFLQNAITTSMHALGIENRQELVALQAVVDEQTKMINELTARIKVLETRQHMNIEKFGKINKTINILNPDLVLRIIKYQKELDSTLKNIMKRQDFLSEDSTKRLNDLRELVTDFPIILARLTSLEKELLESKDLVEKLKKEVLR